MSRNSVSTASGSSTPSTRNWSLTPKTIAPPEVLASAMISAVNFSTLLKRTLSSGKGASTPAPIFHALDAQLVVDSENHCAARGVGQRDDLGGQFFDVAEADFEFQEGVFASAHHSHQLSA